MFCSQFDTNLTPIPWTNLHIELNDSPESQTIFSKVCCYRLNVYKTDYTQFFE